LSLFQNSVSFEKALEKLFKRTIFPVKFKVDFPKTEVLENLHLIKIKNRLPGGGYFILKNR